MWPKIPAAGIDSLSTAQKGRGGGRKDTEVCVHRFPTEQNQKQSRAAAFQKMTLQKI